MTQRGPRSAVLAGQDSDTRAPEQWVENRARSGWWPGVDWAELWSYRDLALLLALRDVRLRYKQTAFGISWAVLQPLLAMAAFSAVFGQLTNVPSDGLAYPVFVFAGLAPWFYLSSSVLAAAESLVKDRDLVTKVYFPRLIAPVAAVLPGLLDLLVAIVALAIVGAVYGVSTGWAVLLVPVWVAAAVLVATGVGLWMAALNVMYRDARYALGYVIQFWLFVTPVVFPASLVHGLGRVALSLNPASGVVTGFRWATVGGAEPRVQDLASLVIGALLLIGGIVYFRKVERRFADTV